MPLTAAQLNSELTTDPLAYGYRAFISVAEGGTSSGSTRDAQLLDLIVFPRDGATVCPVNSVAGPAVSVKNQNLMPPDLMEVVDERDFIASPSAAQLSHYESLSNLRALQLVADDGVTATRILGFLRRLFLNPGTQGTRARLDALATRVGSRAEKLGGAGYAPTLADVGLAFGRG